MVLEFDIDSKRKWVNDTCIFNGFDYAPLYFKHDKLRQNILNFMHARIINSKCHDANDIFKALDVKNECELSL